jgi:hypothetical protein
MYVRGYLQGSENGQVVTIEFHRGVRNETLFNDIVRPMVYV